MLFSTCYVFDFKSSFWSVLPVERNTRVLERPVPLEMINILRDILQDRELGWEKDKPTLKQAWNDTKEMDSMQNKQN